MNKKLVIVKTALMGALLTMPQVVLAAPPIQSGGPGFDFKPVGVAVATISLGLIGVVMAGSALFPEIADRYKRMIPNVIIGLVLIAIASFLVSSFSGGGG